MNKSTERGTVVVQENGHKKLSIPDALVVGFRPMIFVVLFTITTTAAAVVMWGSLVTGMEELNRNVRSLTYDRWSRSMQIEFCRDLEELNPGWSCPNNDDIPRYILH